MTLLPTKVIILIMNSLENSLNKIAENILHIDEASLTSLWDKYKRKVEQFQVIIAGSEVGNGYSELNDPIDQEERFKEQMKNRANDHTVNQSI